MTNAIWNWNPPLWKRIDR